MKINHIGFHQKQNTFLSSGEQTCVVGKNRHMVALKYAFTHYDGYLCIVEGLEKIKDGEDDDNKLEMTDSDKFNIRIKSYYLLTLY